MTDMIHMAMAEPRAPAMERENWWDTIDRNLIFAILILFALGVVMSFAATPTKAEDLGKPTFYYVYRHLFFGSAALIVMFIISRFSLVWVRRLGIIGFLGSAVILFLLPFIGTSLGKGSIRWLDLGPITVQPVEFLKPGLVIFVSWLIAASNHKQAPPGRMIAILTVLPIVIFLGFNRDFGQAALITSIFFAMLFIAKINIFVISFLIVAVAGGGLFAYNNSSHVAGRIDGFLQAELDPLSQIGTAANAISNGGFFGAGAGEGAIKYKLPDAHTDFIIAVAAEEFGIFMVWFVIVLFAFIVARSFWRATKTKDTFTRLAVTGLATSVGIQSMINLGVSARVVPTKGMTLPFISYGGSSMLAIGITFGFILALTRYRKEHWNEDF